MEWDRRERDAWVSDAQRWIRSIVGILHCKIDLDPEGEISGVHVVANMARDARHIVRDVESMLKARLDIDVYYKKIGVVQVEDKGSAASLEPVLQHPECNTEGRDTTVTFHPEDENLEVVTETPLKSRSDLGGAAAVPPNSSDLSNSPPIPAVLVREEGNLRLVCSGVGVMASDQLIRAEVRLRAGDLEMRGFAEGSNHVGSSLDVVARATLETVSMMLNEPILLHLRDVRRDQLGGQDVVLCAVDMVEGRRAETLFGFCGLRFNEQQAVVFSVLDALNRRLSLFTLKKAEAKA